MFAIKFFTHVIIKGKDKADIDKRAIDCQTYLKAYKLMKKYYAVRKGVTPGIYETWDDCRKQVIGFSGAEYKGFSTLADAKNYMNSMQQISPDTVSEAVAYVDGSFLKEAAMFSFGAVLFYNGDEKHFSKAFADPELVSMRNVAGEIRGAQFIMQYCIDNNIKSIDLYYDYEGIEKWCTGAWKANKSGTQLYHQFYMKICDKLQVNFIKVKAHSSDVYNDLADKLAKEALGIK